MRVKRLLPLMTVVAALVAGAEVTSPPTAVATMADLCARQPSRFGPASRPFGPSLQVATITAARKRITFAPPIPAGRPFRIYVSRENEVRLRRIGLAYRASQSRWFLLTQGLILTPLSRFEQSLRELAAHDPCGTRSSTLTLANGTLALITEAVDRRVVVFRRGRVEILLLSSPSSASRTRLVALANSLAPRS